MASTPEGEEQTSPVWEYVPITEYSLPAAPVTHAVKKRLSIVRQIFEREDTEPESPLKAEEELQTLPAPLLEQVTPAPQWRGAADALDAHLEGWLEQEDPAQPAMLLVMPPHSGRTDILAAWAEARSWTVLSPPSPDQVLTGDDSWLGDQMSDGSPWVFPALERAYLRHAAGLALVRRFLDQARSGYLGRGIVGCDSWAWAFLRHVWQGRMPTTLALQAFDQARLTRHLQMLANGPDRARWLFRQSDNGHYVLPPPDGDPDPDESSDFLQLLAAYSRGILGVAWLNWRASLQTEPDELMSEEAEDDHATRRRTIWVTPWKRCPQPSLPAGAGRDEAFVLHTLLLHDGLPLEWQQQVLPLAPNQVVQTLLVLEEAGLVAQHDAAWQVSPMGYPVVRQFLQDGGYLVDRF